MFKYSKDGISVLTILDTRRAKKSGQFPVKVQVVYRRKQKYYSTGKEVSKEDWARLLKVKSRLLAEIRSDIESSFSTIKQQVNELIQKGEFSIETLSVRLGRQMNDMTLRSAFRLKMKELEAYEQANTYLNYQSALKSLEDFGGSTIPLENITIDWLKRCEKFWISEGKSYSSISIYFRALKCVLNRAVHDGIIKESSFPFGKNKYEIPEGCGRKLALTLSEIKKVMSYQCETKDIEEFRDLWVFSYLCNGSPLSSVRAFDLSSLLISVSPIKTAFTLAFFRLAMSVLVLIPLSPTNKIFSGTSFLRLIQLLISTVKSFRLRLLTPIIFAPQFSAILTSSSV